MRTIIDVIRTPIRVETKVSAPRMSAAPIEAKRMTNHDMTLVSVRVTDLGPAKVSRTAALAAMGRAVLRRWCHYG
jgi:hypothetical protein